MLLRRREFLFFLFVLLLLIFLFLPSEDPLVTTNPSIFVYRAYYDNRTTAGRIRILAVTECVSPSLMVSFADGIPIPLLGSPIEGSCPWTWAPGCRWNAFMFESRILERAPEKLKLAHGSSELPVEVNRTPLLRDTLQLCVPPLYWYSDWPRLVLFFELWRPDIEKVIIYVHAVSRSVRRVLQYYEKEGLAEIVEWPSLPRTETDDPNRWMYRVGHSLAHNDCVMRASAQYVALVDIDEYLYIKNTSVLEYARKKLRGSVASMTLSHIGLDFGGPIIDDEFGAIISPRAFHIPGPSKTVFVPSRVLFLSTHVVRVHVEGFQAGMVPLFRGALLHHRTSFGKKIRGKDYEISTTIFTEQLLTRVRMVRDIVFPITPGYNYTVAQEVGICLGRWRTAGCKSPMTQCWSEVYPLEDWLLPHTTMTRLH